MPDGGLVTGVAVVERQRDLEVGADLRVQRLRDGRRRAEGEARSDEEAGGEHDGRRHCARPQRVAVVAPAASISNEEKRPVRGTPIPRTRTVYGSARAVAPRTRGQNRKDERWEASSEQKVAILAADMFERVELEQPRDALKQAGAEIEIVSLKPGEIKDSTTSTRREHGQGRPARRGGLGRRLRR